MTTGKRLEILRSMIRLALEKEISFLAGSIAFFAFLSLVPAMVLVLAIGSLLGGAGFAAGIVGLVEGALSEEGAEVLQTALADTTGLAGASVVGVVILFWSTLRVFRALDIAFDRIYQVQTSTSLTQQILNASIVILSITTTLMVLLLVRTTVSFLAIRHVNLLSVPLMMLGLIAVLTPMYYVMPPVSVSLRDVFPGALSAVCGLLLLHQLFHLYTSQASQYQAYGFMGAVLLFLLWLYIGAIILLLGVVINATLMRARRTGVSESAAGSFPVTPHLIDVNAENEEEGNDQQDANVSTPSDTEAPQRTN